MLAQTKGIGMRKQTDRVVGVEPRQLESTTTALAPSDADKSFLNDSINSSELLASPKMIALTKELKTRYSERLVLYDLPPLLPTDDALTFLQHVDGCLLVFEEGKTQKRDIERTMQLLDGYNVIGTVLNKSSEARNTAYYQR